LGRKGQAGYLDVNLLIITSFLMKTWLVCMRYAPKWLKKDIVKNNRLKDDLVFDFQRAALF